MVQLKTATVCNISRQREIPRRRADPQSPPAFCHERDGWWRGSPPTYRTPKVTPKTSSEATSSPTRGRPLEAGLKALRSHPCESERKVRAPAEGTPRLFGGHPGSKAVRRTSLDGCLWG
jgi:hypothetical protein